MNNGILPNGHGAFHYPVVDTVTFEYSLLTFWEAISTGHDCVLSSRLSIYKHMNIPSRPVLVEEYQISREIYIEWQPPK